MCKMSKKFEKFDIVNIDQNKKFVNHIKFEIVYNEYNSFVFAFFFNVLNKMIHSIQCEFVIIVIIERNFEFDVVFEFIMHDSFM